MVDICIIGGGAAGLAAGVVLAQSGTRQKICILEKKDEPGRKILATGNGRCNMTNVACEGAEQVLEFFKGIGVYTRVEGDGRIYPYDGRAASVLRGLLSAIDNSEIELKTGCSVTDITEDTQDEERGRFIITTDKGVIRAKKLLLACGGKAGPQWGTAGEGYKWAGRLGHTVTKTAPVLAPVICGEDMTGLKGIRARGRVTLLKKGRPVAREAGEIQFTDQGLSGICVFNLTRHMIVDEGTDVREGLREYSMDIDLMPELTEEEFLHLLEERGKNGIDTFLSLADPGLEKFFLKDPHQLKSRIVNMEGVKGWRYAQCTAGGVPQEEIRLGDMSSRVCEGLYLAGEIIDYDGPCGGYNLNNAWYTGIKAGKALRNVYIQDT